MENKELLAKTRVRKPLFKSIPISIANGKGVRTEIFCFGKSIGTLIVITSGLCIFKKNAKGYNDLVKRYPGIPNLEIVEDWYSRNMTRFRSFLYHLDGEE